MTTKKTTPGKLGNNRGEPRNTRWRTPFLQHLAATSNISAAAEAANTTTAKAYQARRTEPQFAAAWLEALCEGYELLEMELLGYLRNPDPGRKFDVANALRVLAAHRETIARKRALDDNRDEQEVLDSIDAMIDEMRRRSTANAALLAQQDNSDEPDQ
ncbi:MAG: hypothetical protein J0M19_01060 [Sphingomonadales bacterium]|nr:hypothetical protein [Sphingomonadales bacterium]